MKKHTNEHPRDAGAECSEASPQLAEAMTVTLRLLGGKWKLLILWHLWRRTLRFNELKRAIPGITQHMLTTQLRELEADGIVSRTVYAEVPPRVEYALTEYAATLEQVLRPLAAWGSAHVQRSAPRQAKDTPKRGAVTGPRAR